MPTNISAPTIVSTARFSPWIRLVCLGASFLVLAWAFTTFITSTHTLDEYNNLVLSFVLPLVMAFVFWFVGLMAWRVESEALAPLYFLTFACLLSAGVLSSVNSTVGGPWFALFQIWIAPLFLHVHLQLSTPSISKRIYTFLKVWYGISVFLTVPLLFFSVSDWDSLFWFPFWRNALRLNLAFSILATFALIAPYYGAKNTTAVERRRIRLLLCGTLLAIAPFLLLSLLPEILRFPYRLDYIWTLPFLLLNPLTYAYVMGQRHQQIRYEAFFQQFASYYLSITLVAAGLFAGASVLYRGFGAQLITAPWVALLAGVGILVGFGPLLRWAQQVVRQIWYGREIPASEVITRLSDALARSLDWTSLEKLLLANLPSNMLLERATLYLEKDFRGLTLAGTSGNGQVVEPPTLLAEGALVDTLTRVGQPIFHEELVDKVDNAPLREEERQLLLLSPFYWVPLLSRGHLHGLLLVGPRLGNDWMSVDDTRVLTTLANQAGTAAHNVRLMEEVRARREDLAEAHQQLVIARENERQALARELHDDAIQQLIGIGYQVQLAQRRLTASPTADTVAAVRVPASQPNRNGSRVV